LEELALVYDSTNTLNAAHGYAIRPTKFVGALKKLRLRRENQLKSC